MKATFIVRNPLTGEFEKHKWNYCGCVPEKTWERYAKEFLKLEAVKYFWPLDPLEAYQDGVIEIEKTAEKIRRGELVLRKANPATYLSRTGKCALLHCHAKMVLPARRVYRAVEKETYGRGAVGIDGFDIDNFDGTTENPSPAMQRACETTEEELYTPEHTARELGELLPGVPNGELRIKLSREILEALFEHLAEEPVRAFRGYIAADGNFLEAARIARISKTKYYHRWPVWIRTAKNVAEKINPFCH